MPNTLISSIAATAFCTALTVPAIAGPTYENQSGGTFTFYGHFNPAFVSFDDGATTTDDFADNDSSSSRAGFWIRQPFGENQFRFRFETNLGFRLTSGLNQNFTPSGLDWDRTRLRHVDFQYETANYGTFYFGQGSMATDGIGDRTLSGTALAAAVPIADVAGGFELRTGAGVLSGIEIGDAFPNFDGSRRGRLRYDTPDFNGFTLRLAYGENILTEGSSDDFYDIALAYEGELDNGIEIEAGLGYQVRMRPGVEDQEDTFGSFAIALPSGFNATLAAGERNTAGDYYYVQVGYKADFFAFGETALSVDFYSGSDAVTSGDDAEAIGIGITQDIDKLNVEAYFGFRSYEYTDTSATTYQDAESYIIGARWRF